MPVCISAFFMVILWLNLVVSWNLSSPMPKTAYNKWSLGTYILCCMIICYTSFVYYPGWSKPQTEAAISWDVSGYYWYLPSIFIYNDLKHQVFKDSILKKYNPTSYDEFQQGMAVMYLPFFTAAHLVAGALGYPRDGFSPPYQFAIQFGGFLICILGLFYLRKLLLFFYEDKIVAIALLLLVAGSNYLNYAAIDNGMSHCWLFTVYVFLLLNTHYFYQSFKLKYAVRIGLLIGLATLTRPTDIISCLIPLLWGMNSIAPSAIGKQLALFAKNYKALLVTAICAAIVIAIQPVYWKYASGHWLVYSYNDQHLYFRSPSIMNYTFSYRSGWLTYCPMMALAFIGILPFIKNGTNKVAIIAFFLINYYVVCSWSIWWYGGRAMVQSYPILVFPVAELVRWSSGRKIMSWLLAAVSLALIYFNIWAIHFYHNFDEYDPGSVSGAYFWRVAGRWHVPAKTLILEDNPDMYEDTPHDLKQVWQYDFSKDTGSLYMATGTGKPKALKLDADHQRSDLYRFAFNGQGQKWLRVQGTFHCEFKEWTNWQMAQFIVRLKDHDRVIKENMERVYRVMEVGSTKEIDLDMKLPAVPYDSVEIFFWNADSKVPLWISDMKAWSFKD